jgi:hypothetical protein
MLLQACPPNLGKINYRPDEIWVGVLRRVATEVVWRARVSMCGLMASRCWSLPIEAEAGAI